MAYGYNNKNTFTPTARQNWICIGDGKESAFFLNQFGEGGAPEGAVRASDNYMTAIQENIVMNAEAGFLHDAELNRFVKAATADEGFPEFPAEFTETQQAQATSKGRRVKAGKISTEKLESEIAFHTENQNAELKAIHEYLLAAAKTWGA